MYENQIMHQYNLFLYFDFMRHLTLLCSFIQRQRSVIVMMYVRSFIKVLAYNRSQRISCLGMNKTCKRLYCVCCIALFRVCVSIVACPADRNEMPCLVLVVALILRRCSLFLRTWGDFIYFMNKLVVVCDNN